MSSLINNYYCSQKFTWLSIDIEKRLYYSCCAATPEKINITWLKNNSGNLFNTDTLQQERQAMLANKPVSSCQAECWQPESLGLESRRTHYKTYNITHTDTQIRQPEYLHIILGSTCNLTCVYCCKQFSSAWTRDIQSSGPYFDDKRFNLSPLDTVLAEISQNEHAVTEQFGILVKEFSQYKNLKEVVISGGEPLLYNGFAELIDNISTQGKLVFVTGLGVDSKRLIKQLELIKNKQGISVAVSAETLGRLYEFNRYGNSYEKFLENLKILENYFPVSFSSVLSNTTIHGLSEFIEKFSNYEIDYNFCNDPDYLSINVLDNYTKDALCKRLETSKITCKDSIIESMMKPCSEIQKQKFSSYLQQFSKRRSLNLDIFPPSMLKWLELL